MSIKASVYLGEGIIPFFPTNRNQVHHHSKTKQKKKGRKSALLKITELFKNFFKQKGYKLHLCGNKSIHYGALFQKRFYASEKTCLQCN